MPAPAETLYPAESLFPGDIDTAPTLVPGQSASATTAAGASTLSATLPVAATAGNLIVWAAGGDKDLGTLTLTGFTPTVNLRSTSVSLVIAWKTATGGETTVSGTITGANTSGSTVWVGEYEQAGSGAWTLFGSATNNTTEATTTTTSSGTTGTTTGAGIGIAAFSTDSVNTAGTSSYTNSYTERKAQADGVGWAGLWVAELASVASGATTGTTISRAGGSADQMSGGVIVVGRAPTAAMAAATTSSVTATATAGASVSRTTTATVTATASAPIGAVSKTTTAAVTATAVRTAVVSATPTATSSVTATATAVTASGTAGIPLNPSVWLVDTTTGVLSPLLYWTSLTLSPVANAPGSVSLTYPAGATGFSTLHANVSATPQRDQEIVIRLGGSSTGEMRALLYQKDGDELGPGDEWTFTGHFLEQLLAEVLVGPQATATQELVFGAVSAGTILATVFDQVQARSAALLPGMTRDFTTALDSNGDPWSLTVTDLKFAPDETLLDVAAALVELGLCEFEVTAGRVLRAYNPEGRGVDQSTGATPLRFSHGTNLAQASRRESSRVGDAATATLGKGSEGVYQWASDATAQAQRGRRVEVPIDAGQISSAAGVTAAAQARLAILKTGTSERTHGIVFGQGHPIPRIDFDVADWGMSVTGNTHTRMRIIQWTATFARAGAGARGSVTLNDVVTDRLVATIRRLNAQARGGAVVGTSTMSPEVDDGKLPAQVTGLAASSSAYVDADGATQAAIAAAWTDVTTNADATAADDITGYLVQFRYTAGGSLPAGWFTVGQVVDNAADWGGLVASTAVDVRVAAVDKWAHVGAWSSIYSLTSGADATPPPTPSTPTVESYLGVLTAEWDGKGSAGEVMPPDFSHVEVHASTSSGFTVHRPLNADGTLNELTSTTYLDRLSGAGTLPSTIGNYGDTYSVKLVSVDRSGNASTASAQDSATLVQAGDGDVSALSVGKLTAGVMSALMTVSGIIRTAASGSRVELDTTGFRCYFGSTLVLNFTIATGALELIGKLTSGAGVGVGSTIVVDAASPPSVQMYTSASASQRFRNYAFTGTGVTGGTVAQYGVEYYDATGTRTGPFIVMQNGVTWIGHQTSTLFQLRGGNIKLEGSGGAGVYLGAESATTGGFINVQEDGDIFVDTNGGDYTIDADSGFYTYRGQFHNYVTATTDQAIFCVNRAIAGGFSGSSFSYGATVDTFCPVFTISGSSDTWGETSATTTGFGVSWSGSAGHSVHGWCWRTESP